MILQAAFGREGPRTMRPAHIAQTGPVWPGAEIDERARAPAVAEGDFSGTNSNFMSENSTRPLPASACKPINVCHVHLARDPSGLSQSPDAGRPSGAARSLARGRAGARAGAVPAPRPHGSAARHLRDHRALPSARLRERDRGGDARSRGWCGSTPTPPCRPAASRRRCAGPAALRWRSTR